MRRIRLRPGVRYRGDVFGGMCYVPQRDDFFALNHAAFEAVRALTREFSSASAAAFAKLAPLVQLGIAQVEGGEELELPFSGPSFVGKFIELPTVSEPLVLNCFTTAWCPLLCKYCHADDLMTPADRSGERDVHIENVLATAQSIPALVAVITGGDPISRPDRTLRLIEGLSGSKALVLDTSGVGNIDLLLPSLITNRVHVRVSLDSALPAINDKARPINHSAAGGETSSWVGARRTILRLIEAGVAVSVQTVVTSENDRIEGWRALRQLLVEWGVKHWVLHVVVAGGKARKIEQRAASQRRPRRLRPSEGVGRSLATLVQETIDLGLPIDVRCTDTDDRPNSVLLVASNGDLYTEGFAKRGKVRLFEAGAGRPDLVQALMAHLDRFGHARRYLNWNPWFGGGTSSLEELCVPFESDDVSPAPSVETEFKLRVQDVGLLTASLAAAGFVKRASIDQRDEYFDTADGMAAKLDYVIRLRVVNGSNTEVAFKGPRFFSADNATSRLEFEVPTASISDARAALVDKGLLRTWFLEKRRTEFVHPALKLVAAMDEVPEIGAFLEIEGELTSAREFVDKAVPGAGAVESRNYREIAVEELVVRGGRSELPGLEFNQS